MSNIFFCTARCFKFMLYFPSLSSEISYVSKKKWFFLLENDISNQDLAITCDHHCWCVLLLRHLNRSVRKSIYVYTHMYEQAQTHTCIHTDSCTCNPSLCFTQIFPFSKFLTPFPQNETYGTHYLKYIYLYIIHGK